MPGFRPAHRLDVTSPPRSIVFGSALVFRSVFGAAASFARFPQKSGGTCELQEAGQTRSLRFSPIRLGLPTSLCSKAELHTTVVARHRHPELDDTCNSS